MVEWFLDCFDNAAVQEDLLSGDKARQVVNFFPQGEELKEVGEMVGFIKKPWPKLRWEILEKWGDQGPQYWEADLEKVADNMARKGGVWTHVEYVSYTIDFDYSLRYLQRNQVVTEELTSVKRAFLEGLELDRVLSKNLL